MNGEDERKLFVAGLSDTTTEQSLKELFQRSGCTVSNIAVPRDRQTGSLRGYAFVTLSSAEEAERARSQLDGMFFEGRSLGVRKYSAQGPARRESRDNLPPSGGSRVREEEGRTLYVTNLPFDLDEQTLRGTLSDLNVAEPQSIHLPTNPDGRGRGFGFITMGSAEQARQTLEQVGVLLIKGRTCQISVALPKTQRPATSSGDRFAGDGRARPSSDASWNAAAAMPPLGVTKDEGRRRKERPKPKPQRNKAQWDDDDFEDET